MSPSDQNHAVTAAHRGAGQTSDGAIRQSRFWWIAVLRGALALLFGTAALGSVEVVLGVVLLFVHGGNLLVATILAVVWGFLGGGLLLIEEFRLRRLPVPTRRDRARRALLPGLRRRSVGPTCARAAATGVR